MEKINYKKFTIALVILVAFIGVIYFVNIQVQKSFYPRHYKEYVEKYAKEFSVPEYIIYSVIKVESDFDKNAKSDKGACGLMQLMPDTYDWLVTVRKEEKKDIFDVEENIKYGTYYLSVLYERYDNWTYALCAYNAGMGNVDKWILEDEFYIHFPETKYYVNKLEVVQDKYKSLYYRKGV